MKPASRFPVVAFGILIVGLAGHNLVMSLLWDAGVRGTALDVIAAWKDVLLIAALAFVVLRDRGLRLGTTADLLALAYAGVVLLYTLLPQDWLGGEATARGELYAFRHHLLPVAAYFLGRALDLALRDARRLGLLLLGVAVAVAVVGLLDAWLVPLQWWRDSGVPGWYREQLGLAYEGLSGLPENFVFNTADERPLRRLVSIFLSPLASAYVLVAGFLLLAAWKRVRLGPLWGAIVGLALLATFTRSAIAALAVGLVAVALVERRWQTAGLAAAVAAVGIVFLAVYPDIGPRDRFTAQELEFQRGNAAEEGGTSGDPLSAGDSSLRSHWRNLRDGLETVARHPQGYGPGNAGVSAFRTGVELRAGESTYAELGVDLGVAGLAAFVAWSAVLLWQLRRRSAWLTGLLTAMLALGLQTDIIGVPWVAVVVWGFCGAAVGRSMRPLDRDVPERGTVDVVQDVRPASEA